MTAEQEFNKLLSETIFWDVLASIADGVITIDEEHRIVYCNAVAERMFGYSCEELMGKDVSPIIPEPHCSTHRGYVDRYIQTKEGRVIGKSRECRGQRKDGGTFPVEISYSVSRTAGKLYFTAVIRDISERKKIEREMRFMEKLADVGKAVANVVHEIRKPLMLIGGFARQVECCGALKESEKERQKLKIVVDEVRRLETLLNGVSVLSRPPASSQKRLLHLNDLLRETIELLGPRLKDKEIGLSSDLAPVFLRVTGDPDQLKQVFLNLLMNAVDAGHGRGSIRIVSVLEDTRVNVRVQDSGPGLGPEMAEKIFDPFFTTKPDGTGLGLAIARNIIEDHGGSISVTSKVGEGACFVVSLPLGRA
ncbi:MAG: PAS domain S-box protein [Syntrophobacter sp.]